MTIKRNIFMSAVSQQVKKTSATTIGLLVLCTSSIAPSAFAGEGRVAVEETIVVKFEAKELQTSEGTEKIYRKLKRRAKSACEADRLVVQYLDQSERECAADLVNQFVTSANMQKLTSFHEAKTADSMPVKVAMNSAPSIIQ